jgi:hypothetical protein
MTLVAGRVGMRTRDLIAAKKHQLARSFPGGLHSFLVQPAHLDAATNQHIDRIAPKQQWDDCKQVACKQITERKKNKRNPITTLNILSTGYHIFDPSLT